MSHALRYGIVSRRVWRDDWFRALDDTQQKLWLYLLTSPHAAGIPGVLVAWKELLAADLRWSVDQLERVWPSLEPEDRGTKAFADWTTGLVWLPRALRHDPPSGRNHVQAYARRWGELPDCELRETARISFAAELDRVNPAFGAIFLEGSPTTSPTGSRVRARVRTPTTTPTTNKNPESRAGAHTRAHEAGAVDPPETPPTQLRLVSTWPDEEHQRFAREHGLRLDDELDDYRWHCGQKSEEPSAGGFMGWLRRARKFLQRDEHRTTKPPGAVEHERRVAARVVRTRPRKDDGERISSEELVRDLEALKKAK